MLRHSLIRVSGDDVTHIIATGFGPFLETSESRGPSSPPIYPRRLFFLIFCCAANELECRDLLLSRISRLPNGLRHTWRRPHNPLKLSRAGGLGSGLRYVAAFCTRAEDESRTSSGTC